MFDIFHQIAVNKQKKKIFRRRKHLVIAQQSLNKVHCVTIKYHVLWAVGLCFIFPHK